MSRKALVVGINQYPGNELTGCVNDAIRIKELLETNQDGSPNFEVKFVPDIANKGYLNLLLEELFLKGDADISLFYFSGHGTDEGGGHIITPDCSPGDLGISMNNILRMVNKSQSKNKIIILDCCFSGRCGEIGIISSEETVLGDGVTIMTASRRNEYSIENKYTGHGIFTSLLIQGLQGRAADILGNITPASLYSFVDQSLGAWEQRPLFKTNICRFLPIRKINPKVSIEILRKLSDYFESPTDEYSLDPSFEFTNNPEYKIELKEPYSDINNVAIFKELQLYESVGLIEPVGTEHMYFAAMENKSCKLTPLGLHYWNLAKNKRF